MNALSSPVTDEGSFRAPSVSASLLYRIYEQEEGGKDLTPEERERWDEYVTELEGYEHRRDTLGLVDLAEVMESGVTEPEMLTDRLVRSEHHSVYGMKEASKTWLLAMDVRELLGRGEAVVWIDKEMGRKNTADRFLTLGIEPDLVREHFTYLEHPVFDCGRDSKAAWAGLLEVRQPALVVVDAQTEVLADAGLNENSGTDVEKWSQAYITPARRVGAATVVLDHTGHTEQGRPVASRQKGAAAKVELSVTKDEPFGRDRVGQVTVEVTKNTVSAPIPKRQSFRIGGDGDGGFIFEKLEASEDPRRAERAERLRRIDADIVAKLWEHRERWPLTQKQITDMVRGSKKEVTDRLKDLALSEVDPVEQEPGPRGSLQYSLVEGYSPPAPSNDGAAPDAAAR